MSGKVSGYVWDLELPQSEKYVLLAYADHADHDGNNIYPSVALVAKKTGLSERQVIRVTKKLVEGGHMIQAGKGKNGTNKFNIPMKVNDKMSPPEKPEGVTPEPTGGDISNTGGDIAMSPDPSLEPSMEPSMEQEGDALDDTPPNPIPPISHPVIKAYRDASKLTPPEIMRLDMVNTVTDLDRWKEIVKEYIGRGFHKGNIVAMLDVYRNGWRNGNGTHKNGHHPPSTPYERSKAALAQVIQEQTNNAQ